MQLKLTRSQRESGVLSKAVWFCLDARVQLTSEEQADVSRYRLGGQVIYNNEASKRRVQAAEAAMATGTSGGSFKAIAQFALARLHLNITVDSLQRGQHIECKSLEELREAEDALIEACKTLKAYLAVATTFDGREELIDFSGDEPVVISTAPPPALVAPGLHMAPSPAPTSPPPSAPPPEPEPPPTEGGTGTATSEHSSTTNRFDAWLAAVERYRKTLSPEMQVLVMAVGLVVLVVLYEVL
jgi:hypothetical protein